MLSGRRIGLLDRRGRGLALRRARSSAAGLFAGVVFVAGLATLPAGLVHRAAAGGNGSAPGDPPVDVPPGRIGKVVAPIELRSTTGRAWSLGEAEDAQATVIVFLNFDCPISNRAVPVLNQLADRHGDEAVVFVGLVCDAEDAA